MDQRLAKILYNLKLEEYINYFKSASIYKVIGSKDHLNYTLYISMSSNLPYQVYHTFYSQLVSYYKDLQISLSVKVEDIKSEYIIDYVKGYISEIAKKNNSYSYFVESEMKLTDSFIIYVSSVAEQEKLEKIKKEIHTYLNSVGYDILVKIVLNQKENENLQKEINDEIINNSYVTKERMDSKDEVVTNNPYKKKYQPKPIVTADDPRAILGRIIDSSISRLDTISSPTNNVTVEANIFDIEIKETKTDLVIISLKITDYTDSIYAKIFVRSSEEVSRIKGLLKVGSFYKFRGNVKEDKYSDDISLIINDINVSERRVNERIDDAEVKRIELHAHTMMSQMDGLVDAKTLVKQAYKWGHKAIAITDHNGCQSYPDVFHTVTDINRNLKDGEEPFKAIYGAEMVMIDDSLKIVVRPQDLSLKDTTYVVFDLETTGFNAGGKDSIIEIGAVKLKDGVILETYDELINPERPLPEKIVELTEITDEMLKDKRNEEAAVKSFKEWTGSLPVVAHNAKFDTSFIEMAYHKYNLGEFENTVIDTLELSRALDTGYSRHGLSQLVKRYNVPWDEEAHHRGDYDAQGTALVFHKMIEKLVSRNFRLISDLDKLVDVSEIHKYGRPHHINILVKNRDGLKNLFRIVSLANTTYLYKTPRILRSEIEKNREGLLIGSGCYESEIFTEARSKSDEELTNLINFYDYVEVQPLEVYDHLLQMGDFSSKTELMDNIKKIIRVTEEAGKIIVATGDVHHLNKEDKIFREIIVNQKVPGGGRHPLARKGIDKIPMQHFRTTREMLEDFDFLDEDKAFEIVVTNTHKIADMVDIYEVIIDTGGTPFSPRVKSDDGLSYLDCPRVVTDLVYDKASLWYGDVLPYAIEERIATELYGDVVLNSIKKNLEDDNNYSEQTAYKLLHQEILKGSDNVKELVKKRIKKDNPELTEEELDKKLKKSLGGVIGAGFDPIYLIAQRLVKHSNDEGFLVGSRGSVGSSFVATMMGITEVNPLAAHYRCKKCKVSIFGDDDGPFGSKYSSGFDLPDKECPNCHIPLIKDGQDMPFATFLGFNADKVPDIDLNFSDLNQASTHAYTKVLFGADNVFRAGTIGTVASKTAFGFVKGYCRDKNIVLNNAEIDRLSIGCTGVKRTTGQHPGGIVVIPDYMDCFDFTPYQYPAEDPTSAWRTTHFDYHSIEECVLKLDILGHSDPTQLRIIQLQSNTNIMDVPLDDKDTMSIFTSTKALGVTKEQIMCNTGTLGIPEFGTPFTIKLVEDTKPTTFGELIKISGLSHGTDVWLGNAQELIKNNIVPFKDTIGCRDDIMVYLMYKGVEPIKAFKIMEFVRKGKASKDKETWSSHVEVMKSANIPSWFIDSCFKIKYMFPKAHAAAYVISAFRIAWYKVHMPVYFYASWLSSKATDVDLDVMIRGYEAIRSKIIEIQEKGYDATNKENGQLESLKVSLEASARGIKFLNVDLYESDSVVWKTKNDNEIYPPFNAIEGLGDTVAKNIVVERDKRKFLSIEEFQKRCKISQTLLDKMRSMNIFTNMEESNQLSLF